MPPTNTGSESKTPLHLPEGLNYTCVKCGRGCEDFPEIRVDEATAERLRSLPTGELIQDAPPEGPAEPPVAPSPWTPDQPIMRRTQGNGDRHSACCLLTADNLCALHCAHGEKSKPLTCRNFPYGFIETPGGVYTGLSFACTAVLENEGAPVAAQREEVEETYGFSPTKPEAPEEIQLAPHLPITWDQYLAIESDLQDIMKSGRPLVGHALVAQSAYLRMLSKFLRQTREVTRAEPAGETELNLRPMEVFKRRMESEIEGQKWGRLFQIMRKGARSDLRRRTTLGYILAFRRATDVHLGRWGNPFYVMGEYLKYALGRGSVEAPRLSASADYRQLINVRFDSAREDHQRLLRRYFEHSIFRKELLRHDEVVFAHNMMLMTYGFIHWHAAAHAVVRGSGEIEHEDLVEGLRTVEERYVFHSRFTQVLAERPMLKAILENMFHRPIFAHAMVNPESPKEPS